MASDSRAGHRGARAVRRRPGAVAGESTPRPAIPPWRPGSAARLGAVSAVWLCLLWQTPQPQGSQGPPRAYAYYRCLGTDAYRFGGERVCQNTQVRTDLLDVAVWQEVCTLLAHPERLAEEYRRRLQPETRAKRTSLATVEAQIGKLRQGVARLIDSYAEGLIDKD